MAPSTLRRLGRPLWLRYDLNERFPSRLSWEFQRTQHQIRRAGIRDGSDVERPFTDKYDPALLRHLSDFFRLHAQRDPLSCALSLSCDLSIHPRFDLPRRRWAHASIDRTIGLFTGHPPSPRDPPR